MKETVLFNDKGQAVGIEVDEYSMGYPLSHSFEDVNNFVHTADYEELSGLCLSLATELDKSKRLLHNETNENIIFCDCKREHEKHEIALGCEQCGGAVEGVLLLNLP